jgi:hypothetical protein
MEKELKVGHSEDATDGSTGRHFCFRYEGKPYHATKERVTVLEIKQIVGQEADVAIAEVVDGRQVERANDYVVELSKDCSFKRVPDFVRG